MKTLKNISLAVLIFTVFLCQFSKAQSGEVEKKNDGQNVDEKQKDASDANTERPAWANAAAKVFSDWKIIQCDRSPTVKLGKNDGYRLILQKSRKEYPDDMQQQARPYSAVNKDDQKNRNFVLRHSHIDLVVLPEDKEGIASLIKGKIPWMGLEQEQFVKPVYLGKGLGFEWFVNATLYHQECLRDKLGLVGGDDRLQLLVDGLFVQDKHDWTRNSLEHLVAKAGDEALPYIQKAVEQHINNDPGLAVRPLAYMYSEQSTQLLKSFYALPETRDAVAYALIHKPYRKEAKVEYLDILKRQAYVSEAIEACIEFDWKDFIPILENICSKPRYWPMFRDAFIAKRHLEGHPISNDVMEAKKTLLQLVWSPSKIDSEILQKAKQTMLQYQDVDAVAVIAIDMALFNTKANGADIARLNEVGWEILRKIPVQTTRKLLEFISKSFKEEYQQRDRLKLQEFLDSLPE
ncbi:MAG: hypothetical protein WC770_05280 [Phycisphaerae bacterium]|jgi:hypothetical protein